jgi:hypothetical protein
VQRSAWPGSTSPTTRVDDEGRAAHIPERALGIIGSLTPEWVEKLKGMIRRYL